MKLHFAPLALALLATFLLLGCKSSEKAGNPSAGEPAEPKPAEGSGDIAAATKENPYVNTLGMKFVPVPGTDVLFCQHETRSKDYAVFMADPNRGYEMTGVGKDDWRTFEYDGVPIGRGAGEEAEASAHPVVTVSWNDAVAFCEWLSRKEKKTYRLPTDREWSVAVGIPEEAKGSPHSLSPGMDPGLKDKWPWGNEFPPTKSQGNFYKLPEDGYATTAPVMQFTPNALGLYDMGGNSEEWTASDYDGNDLLGKDKTIKYYRALRGGSWDDHDSEFMLSAQRGVGRPADRGISGFGFRVVAVVVKTPVTDSGGDLNITTVEAASKELAGTWKFNLAETKKLMPALVPGESRTVNEDAAAKLTARFTESGGLEILPMLTITKFELKAGQGDNNFTISNISGQFAGAADPIPGDETIGVSFGSKDRLTLNMDNFLMGSLVFDRQK